MEDAFAPRTRGGAALFWPMLVDGADTSTHAFANTDDGAWLYCMLHVPRHVPLTHRGMPILVFVHGSGFKGGAHLLDSPPVKQCRDAILRGYCVLQIEHRPAHSNPIAGLHDVVAAIRWVRHLATTDASLGLDPDRIGIMGISSGGSFAAMAALLSSPRAPTVNGVAPRDLIGSVGEHADVSSHVRCAVDFFGPADPRTTEETLYGHPTPVALASASAPPVLIAHGTDDKLVPMRHSIALHEALMRVGAMRCTLYVVEGGEHSCNSGRFKDDDRLLVTTREFLDKYLKGVAPEARPL